MEARRNESRFKHSILLVKDFLLVVHNELCVARFADRLQGVVKALNALFWMVNKTGTTNCFHLFGPECQYWIALMFFKFD